ncbi:MAG: hypothetical protein E7370_01590 [Clostridiales bacterium]|nr:hypothetical protein [Clostridiales bacterium]
MSNILTPISLWKNFDDTLPLNAKVLGEKVDGEVKIQYIRFDGRDTGKGRVSVFGAYAEPINFTSTECILILPDSYDTIDEELLKYFVKNGYSAFMVDYRGKVDGTENYTVYPANVYYANLAQAGRRKDFVDESADKTSWYEWVSVGRYAYNYLNERLNGGKIGVVGIRDGGEIAWKLIASVNFSCAVTISAAGWKAYEGYNKSSTAEPVLDEERYRFIAGIDSQAYAPYIKCPVLMLCSVNDYRFDYDRAHDTFSRINDKYLKQSMIAYSVKFSGFMGIEACCDMFMFLDKNVKGRHVFLPKPSEINITVDENDNLVADAIFDEAGTVEKFGLYVAEDCKESALREWSLAKYKGQTKPYTHRFYLDVYEKTSIVYAFCYATYSNGFTVWSRISVKKISGKFRNMQSKCRVMYTSKNNVDCFIMTNRNEYALSKIFLLNNDYLPKVVKKAKNIEGIYSECGLTTYRINSPRYSPNEDSVLKLDVFCDTDSKISFLMRDIINNEIYAVSVKVVGGVWQNVILKSSYFKTENGAPLNSFASKLEFSISCKNKYAINNVMWL